MNSHHDPTSKMAVAPYYQIKIKGTLERHWANRLGGLDLQSKNGITTLTGQIIDQAALHGLIMQIRDLGLPLLLVEQIEINHKENKT